MPRIERMATAVWEGTAARGRGTLTVPSAALADAPFSVTGRTSQSVGTETSPEELLAAAHAGCFAMALSGQLTRRKAPPERLIVEATTVLDEVDDLNRIVASTLAVTLFAEGLADADLEEAVADADRRCPFSALVRDAGGVVDVDVRVGES